MRKTIVVVLAFLSMLLFHAGVWAKDDSIAVLSEVEGEVLLFQGDRYLPVKQGRRLKEGDRLMIMENSRAHLVFDDDCEITWEGAKIIDVSADACNRFAALWTPCLDAAANADGDQIILSQLVGTALIRRNGQYLAVQEGQALQEGDELKLDGAAEISYPGACVTTHEGKTTVKVSSDACPIAQIYKVEGDVLVDSGKDLAHAVQGDKLKDGWKLELPKESHVEVVYFNGCNETWDGQQQVAIDAASCPPGAATPLNCTPAVFGNMTIEDVGVVVGTGVLLGPLPDNPANNPPPRPPISP
ncbi:hypothetical protein [Thiolapillus sp.]